MNLPYKGHSIRLDKRTVYRPRKKVLHIFRMRRGKQTNAAVQRQEHSLCIFLTCDFIQR